MTTGPSSRREALRAHVQTWRPYTVWYVGLLGLAGAGLVDGGQHWLSLIAAWAVPTIGWVGGHYLGDYFDRHLDAISKAHRPIPSGRLAAHTALVCGIECMLAVTVLAIFNGVGTSVVAGLAVAGIVAYGRFLKARGLSGNLTRGALGGLAVAFGAVSAGTATGPGLVALTVVCFVIAVWAHDTASNLVGTLRDMRGDRKGGYRTLSVRRGAHVAGRTALLFYALFVTAAVIGGVLPTGAAEQDRLPRRVLFFIVLAMAVGLGALAWRSVLAHRARVRETTALRAHELLVLERVGFAGAVIGLGFGVFTALVLTAPMLIATWWTQARMRVGYELGSAAAKPSSATDAAPAPDTHTVARTQLDLG